MRRFNNLTRLQQKERKWGTTGSPGRGKAEYVSLPLEKKGKKRKIRTNLQRGHEENRIKPTFGMKPSLLTEGGKR